MKGIEKRFRCYTTQVPTAVKIEMYAKLLCKKRREFPPEMQLTLPSQLVNL